MQKKEIKNQAEQFLDYFAKFKGKGLDEIFGIWTESKDFDEETKRGIRREVEMILKQRGDD